FGVIERLQRALREATGLRRSELPKLDHGGTLDPFATGLLVVAVGPGVKLAQYLLGPDKAYEGVIRVGETTVPGAPTEPPSQRPERWRRDLGDVRLAAAEFMRSEYLQTPPMHSAKKQDGKRLYELAREGVEVERPPKACRIHRFEILSYDGRDAR